MRFSRLAVFAALPAMLAACGPGGLNNQEGGTVVGAVAGGLIGNSVGKGNGGKALATIAGAVVGGVVGSEIGRRMDEHDRMLAQQEEYDALESGESGRVRQWRNPDSGHYGEVVPGRPYKRGVADCRDYTHKVYIDGEPQTMRGTACRNPDGTWRNVG